VKSGDYESQSDSLYAICATFSARTFPNVASGLNPKMLRTKGKPQASITGFPMAGGTYTASFVPRAGKGFKLYVPSDGEASYT
jgi:hypothetical protein